MDRADALLNMIVLSSPGGIEEQEKRGQRNLEVSETLPHPDAADRLLLEQLGFVFGESVDDLFVSVKMPEGWSKKAQEGTGYWTDLLDEQGRIRGSIFYKAAFYDRKADMHLNRRYKASSYIGCDVNGTKIEDEPGKLADYSLHAIQDWDGSIVRTIGHRPRRDYAKADELELLAAQWLEENKPDWENPLAYWNPETTLDA